MGEFLRLESATFAAARQSGEIKRFSVIAAKIYVFPPYLPKPTL
jgi:hypothetical protein